MSLEQSGGTRRPLAQCAGIALVSAVLAACGGGGGGGGGGNTSGNQQGSATEGPGGGTGTCRATQNTVRDGLTLGACITFENDIQRNDIGFKELPYTVAIDPTEAKRYTLTVSEPVAKTETFRVSNDVAASDEDRCQNRLGAKAVLTLSKPQLPQPGQAYMVLTSATQSTGGSDPRPDRCANVAAQPPALALRAIDFGTWEVYLGGAENYYSGWLQPRAGITPVQPNRNVTFDGAGPNQVGTGDAGIAVGYSFTRISSFGVSAVLRDVRFSNNRITGVLDTFQYSRLVGTRQEPEVTLRRLTFAADVSNGQFDGTLTGEGTVTPVTGGSASAGTVAGRIRGAIVNAGTAGFEVAARYQAVVTVAGSDTGLSRVAGAFAATE